MKRGIFINAILIGILVFIIALPIIVFGLADLVAKANDCVISPTGWGEGICRDMYTLTFLTGLIGSITSPIGIGILILYLLGVLIYILVNISRTKRAGKQVSPSLQGMIISTLGFLIIGGVTAGSIIAYRWYFSSYISACKGLPKPIPQMDLQNGLIAIGTKPAYPDNRREAYKIQLLSLDGMLEQIPSDLTAAKTPAWSADGRSIVFAAQSESSGLWGLYLIEDNKQVVGPILENTLELAEPRWAPDGGSLIFQRWEKEDPNPKTQLYTVNLDGSNVKILTDEGDMNGKAQFSPDGSRIVFVSDHEGGKDIYVMQVDGSEIRRLTYHPQEDIDPDWSPDGRWIVFSSSRNSSMNRKNYDLYIMAPDGSNQCQLTSGDHLDLRPSWSPDGAWIAYIEWIEGKVYQVRPDGSELTAIPIPEGVEALSLDWGVQP